MLQRSISYLFTPRIQAGRPPRKHPLLSPFPFEVFDAVVLALYAAILSWDIHYHVPWIDEAQAWLIARDDSLRDLLLRRLHYEGAPALWHLILKTAIALHLPYAGLNWLAGAFGFTGIFILIRFSPFPRIFRWLLPFTFFLQYQYAVIARPYVLAPLLLFTLAIVYSLPKPRPILFALVAGLLANINAHAGILSCVFALLYLYDLYRRHELALPSLRRHTALAAALFTVLCCLSVIVAYPAPDAMVVPTATGKIKKANPLLRRLLPPEQMPSSAPPLDPSLDEVAQMRASAAQAPDAAATTLTRFQKIRTTLHFLRHFTEDVATFPVAESNLLSVIFLCTFALWLWSRRTLRLLLPWLITTPLAAYIWVYDHHTGLFAVALIATAWISLQCSPAAHAPRAISTSFAASALLVVLLQIGWVAHQARMEPDHPYDAGKQTEAFLATHYAGKRIAGFSFQSVSMQPYTERNLFFNQEHPYWLWSNANPIDMRRTEALLQHPDVVVVGDLIQGQDTLYNQWAEDAPAGFRPYAEMVRFWQEHGYHETHRFCGDRYMRAGIDNSLCELIFEPNQPAQP